MDFFATWEISCAPMKIPHWLLLAFQTRAGNYLRGTVIGHGNVPVKQCLSILKSAGYDGTVAIEFEGMEDPVDAVRIGLANLKRYWNEVSN